MELKSFVIVCILSLSLLLSTSITITTRIYASGTGDLLVNGGFEDGLNGWIQSTPAGSYSYNVVNDGTSHPTAMEYSRWNSHSDGAGTGLWQELDILVSDYSALYITLDVKVISNTLHNSGWWADVKGGGGEWPALVRIIYEDVFGAEWIWEHGFFPDDDNEYYGRTNFEYVVRNQWRHYVSPNLVDMTTTTTGPHNEPLYGPPPYRLKYINVGGTGWDVKGLFDSISLRGDFAVGGTTTSINLEHPSSVWMTAIIGMVSVVFASSLYVKRRKSRKL